MPIGKMYGGFPHGDTTTPAKKRKRKKKAKKKVAAKGPVRRFQPKGSSY